MDELLFKSGVKEIIARRGNLVIDYIDEVIALWVEEQQKSRITYYSVEYSDNNGCDYKFFKPLSREQIEEIKQASVIDGVEYDYDEVLDNFVDSFLFVDGPFDGLTPTHIDLNQPYYLYDVDVAIFNNGINNAPEVIRRCVELNTEEYAWLLRKYIIRPYTSFNEIRCLNADLFDKISGCIEANINEAAAPPIVPAYTAELTEIKQHTAEIEQMINEIKENK